MPCFLSPVRGWAAVLILAGGCSGGKWSADASLADAPADAALLIDAPADAPVDSRPPPCWELRDQWNELVAALDRSCETVSECGFAGGAGDCDCVPSLSYSGSGVAIQTAAYLAAVSQFVPIVDEFTARCQDCFALRNACICDAAPAAVACVNHMCVATPRSCLDPHPDAAPPADAP